jgi:TIR domain-containing protein
MTSGTAKVFISYRREETAGHAGRLYDVMSNRFGEENVFMDVDIAPGVDFVERIKDAVGRCHVLLVIMGPRWASAAPGGSLPRIFEPEDFVRLEVETGIARQSVTVIPVLVGGATMPDPTALPAPLRPVTRRNAIELSDTRWRYDVDRLMGALGGLLKDTSAVRRVPPPPAPAPVTPQAVRPAAARPLATPPRVARAPVAPAPITPPAAAAAPRRLPGERGPLALVLIALSTTILAAIVARLACSAASGLPAVDGDDKWKHALRTAAVQGVTWAVVGAVVAIWLAVWLGKQDTGIGSLLLGAVTGAVAGAGSAAIYNVPKWVMEVEGTKLELLRVVEVGALGALIGSLIAWVWRRRGSAGLALGLVVGGLLGIALRREPNDTDMELMEHALIEAIVIVGVVAVTQALLDAWEASSSRATSPSAR